MGYRTYTCPIARTCGGCEWLAVPYPIQLERKQAFVQELLGEPAEKDGAVVETIRGIDDPVAYRLKAATPFSPGKGGRIRSGFYAMGTHRIVACESCLVEDPRARRVLNAVARAAEHHHVSAYDEDRGKGVLRHAVVRFGYESDEALLVIVTNGPDLPHLEAFMTELREQCPEVTSVVQNVNDRRTNAILGWTNKTLYGPGCMHDRLLGCTFEIGPTSFYQTNPAQTEVLYQLAIDGAELLPGQRLLDAYCGTGTIGICAASLVEGLRVIGVEQVGDAVARAGRNARANGAGERCRFLRSDATEYMDATVRADRPDDRFDVVVMDPPRAGSTPKFLAGVSRLGPSRIAYVSCNVVTQARDITILRDYGYRLERVTPVDMFPHTKHVESVAILSRAR